MSGSLINLSPSPVNLGAMQANDLDKAFGLDFAANMAARVDTIATFTTLTITRTDRIAIGATDIVASNLQVSTDGLSISWTLQGGGAVASYILAASIVTTDGNQLTRTAMLSTLEYLG